jgi:hypothetical protein
MSAAGTVHSPGQNNGVRTVPGALVAGVGGATVSLRVALVTFAGVPALRVGRLPHPDAVRVGAGLRDGSGDSLL